MDFGTVDIHEQAIFDRSPITQALIDLIRQCPEGGELSYLQMQEAIHQDPRKPRHFLESAIEIAQKEYGVVLSARRGSGYVRVRNDEIAGYSVEKTRKPIAAKARLLNKRLDCTDVSALDASGKMQHCAGRIYAALALATGSKRAVSQAARMSQHNPEKQINKASVLKAFRGI